MSTDLYLQAWDHSRELFNLLLEVTSDERIPLDIRLEYLDKIKAAIEKAKATT